MLEKYLKLQPKPKTIDESKVVLQTIWEELAQDHMNNAVANFTMRLRLDYQRSCQWWPLRASAVRVSLSICRLHPHLSTKELAVF